MHKSKKKEREIEEFEALKVFLGQMSKCRMSVHDS